MSVKKKFDCCSQVFEKEENFILEFGPVIYSDFLFIIISHLKK